MKTLIPSLGLCLFLIAASLAKGGVPPLNVTVSDTSGKLAFKGATKSDGGFATEKLQAGNYVVQLSSKNSALKGGEYSIIVAAGKKKVVANSVAGNKFLGGGVALKVDVGAGLGIVGQVSAGPLPTDTAQKDSVRKMQDRAQDQHQEGFHSSLSNTQDKMTRPGN
ncbi:MAG: T9SS type A sorting domain-containing protein [Chthoniobacterales bacterium]